MRGEARGRCAQGFGTCCVFRADGQNSLMELKNRVSHLTNPDYPGHSRSKMTEETTVMIIPNNDDITQIKLTMMDFEMDAGKEDDPCEDHYIEVELPGEDVNIGKLCGNNEEQHLYIHLPDPPASTGTITRPRFVFSH